MTADDLRTLIDETATGFHLPVDLLTAQVQVESGGDPYALRYERRYFQEYILNNPNATAAPYGPFAACSIGLLQILVETACELGFTGRPEQLFDPKEGLTWGAKQMAALFQWATGNGHNYRDALAAYNAGKGNITAGLPYADKVFAAARRAT